jgi:small-conductance mechanosensitive channel
MAGLGRGLRGRRVRRGSRRARSAALRRSARARSTRTAVQRARSHLRVYRQASFLTLALTSVLLLFFDPGAIGGAQEVLAPDSVAADTTGAADSAAAAEAARDTMALAPDSLSREATREATRTLRDIFYSSFGFLPKLLIALGIFAVAGIVVRLLRPLLRRTLGRWERADAFTALSAIGIWLLAVGMAFAVLAGDVRALLGSLGLIGLALSWALQTPIESFTGWLLNSLRGYYRVGDRIAVGDVFGDVYRIDVLTTTVWEYGGPDRPPGWVRAEQPTGRLITIPNNEVLTGTVVNYTRDFPYVWDELEVPVANESDIGYALGVMRRVVLEALGDYMREPARLYRAILQTARLEMTVQEEPEVFVTLAESGAVLTLRYLVGAREKRRWKSELSLRVLQELNRPEHRGKILPVYPRRQVQLVDEGGAPVAPGWGEGPEG